MAESFGSTDNGNTNAYADALARARQVEVSSFVTVPFVELWNMGKQDHYVLSLKIEG